MEDPTSDAEEETTVRRSTRIRPLTEETQDNAFQELKRNFWVRDSKFAFYLNEEQIQMSGDCNHGAIKNMEAEIQEGYLKNEANYDEIKITTPAQDIRLVIDRVVADGELPLNAIQVRIRADDVGTRRSVSDGSERSKANAAAQQIKISALTEKAALEVELEQIQRKLNRKKREIEHERLSVLLRVKRAMIQVYADTRPNGVLGSTSQNHSAMLRPIKRSASSPLCQEIAEIDEPQITETIATSVNVNIIPAESRTSNNDPPTKTEDKHSLERQEIASKMLTIETRRQQVLAPLNYVTGREIDPFAVQTSLEWSIPRGVDQRVDGDAIGSSIRILESDFGDGPKQEHLISQDDRLFLEKVGNGKPQETDGHDSMPLPFRAKPRIDILQQRIEGRRKLKKDSHSAAYTAKRAKRTDSVNHTQEPAPHLTTDIGKDDDITRDRLATVTIKGGESYRPQMQPTQADNLKEGDAYPRITRRYLFDPGIKC